jgi:hypothetical protein
MSNIYYKLPEVPAKPLNGMIVVKRTVGKPPKEAKNTKEPNKPVEVPLKTEIFDLGTCNDLPFKVGDLVNIVDYGTHVITAEIESETEDISFAIINPTQVCGIYG